MITNNKFSFLTLAVSVLALSACSGGTATKKPVTSNSMQPHLKSSSIDKAMEKALAQAEASGNNQEILAMLAQIHGRNPNDAIVATRYARALRSDDQINMAINTLSPYVRGENKNIEVITEMAMAQIAIGDFDAAEDYANTAIEMSPKNARAYLALGTAQDAQSRHQDAEISFRAGLKNWKGDPTPILNNLALNLASQGHLNESLSLLEKALKISPKRMDLERNRRIIATLVETSGTPAPAPSSKPAEAKKTMTPVDVPESAKPKPTTKPAAKTKEKVETAKEEAKEVAKKEIKEVKQEQATQAVKTSEKTEQTFQAPPAKMKLNNLKMKKPKSYN